MIQIALSNIISNAIKYNNMDGLVEITIEKDKNDLVIKVCDDGMGIPKEELDKIFTDFLEPAI
ncbi:MAG: sensor histidine kinase [Ignavibacteriales bacterium]|nr:sensor histidine kinase [Ignavibacteriales bacterium]